MIKINRVVNADKLLELIEKVESEGERIVIEREGKRKIAIINYAELEELEALEDARDSELLRQAIAESNDEFYTFEEVLAERGLTVEDIASDSDE